MYYICVNKLGSPFPGSRTTIVREQVRRYTSEQLLLTHAAHCSGGNMVVCLSARNQHIQTPRHLFVRSDATRA